MTDSDEYGYGLGTIRFAEHISVEYPGLRDTVYLDFAASPPVPTSAIHSFADALTHTLYSNPHSQSPSSFTTALQINRIRGKILQELFGVRNPQDGKWDVIFTAGATAALKLVAETFPWNGQLTRYRYLKESHTSLVGIRGCALAKGAVVESMDLVDVSRYSVDTAETTLWGYPAQCNVTGLRIGLGLARELKRNSRNTAVVVDAAAYLSTLVLDLGSIPYDEAPDFVACSFYKIYGYPTGLGALIVKSTSAHFLSASPSGSDSHAYFGGGTIDSVSVSSPFWSYPRKALHARHEHGTLPFLSIIALDHAMNTHNRLYGSHANVSKHAASVARLARDQLSSLLHANGQALVRQSLPSHAHRSALTLEDAGPIISFSLIDHHGSLIGHKHLENLATVAGFQIRTGAMCNTGVLARVSGLDDGELRELYESGRVCGDDQEFGGKTGNKPLGLARISFGASSTADDVLKFVDFLRKYFLISEEALPLSRPLSIPPLCSPPPPSSPLLSAVYLQTLMRYPIKSCAGQSLLTSKLTPSGLLYDREFMLVNATTGIYMSQKQFPRLALIKPIINDEEGIMKVQAEGMQELIVPLDVMEEKENGEMVMDVRVCSDAVQSYQPSPGAAEWFSIFLGVPCQLHRHATPLLSPSAKATSSRHTHFDRATPPIPILLSNESPFSLISQSSVDAVNSWIASDNNEASAPIHASCFRANLIISCSPPSVSGTPLLSSTSPSSACTKLPPFREDTLDLLCIGTQTFQVLAQCRRCLMICVNQSTGVRMKEPFCCLARHRRNGKRRIEFGIHLMWRGDLSVEGDGFSVGVGDRVVWTEMT